MVTFAYSAAPASTEPTLTPHFLVPKEELRSLAKQLLEAVRKLESEEHGPSGLLLH